MERNSTNENFEQFLRQNAEDFRMHPSDKVWEGISKDLHKPQKRYYFGLILLLVSSSILGYTVYELSISKTGRQEQQLPTPAAKPASSSSAENSITQKTEKGNGLYVEKSLAENSTTVALNTKEEDYHPTLSIAVSNLENKKQTRLADLFSLTRNNFLNEGMVGQKPSFDFNQPTAKDLSEKNGTKSSLPKARSKSSRFSLMFFFTPTVSYRKLTENKSYLRSSPVGAPYSYAALYDINNAVTHKPDIGLEFGATTKYALTKSIKLRAGVQFNINRYDIKAFKYIPEVATIALNNGYRVDSLSTVSNYRNFNGGKTDWLQNFYFQVSAPVGVEVKLHGNEKMHIGVASTIQPTYVIGDRAYLITADYKNYAQVPWLIRRWNVNTNLETFVAYSSGKLNWQIGPQVRYQLLSSFISKYPVKENLFDFGLKVGISLNQNQ